MEEQTVEKWKTAPAVLTVEHLTKVFEGKMKAVDDVSFTIREGEILGLLGPNGAGKSTTIKMLTTVLKPTSGRAEIGGYDILKHPTEVRRIVGVVPQEYTADEDMTGHGNIVLCADLYGISRSVSEPRARELLKLVELEASGDRKVSTYSGGMRRRLELACGLINRPRLLFLDEPTLGLDVQTRAAVWEYIKRLKNEYGMTLLMTTHYLEEAGALCDTIAIIDRGKIVKIGAPEELKESLGGDIIEIAVKEADADVEGIVAKVPLVKSVKKMEGYYRIKAEFGEEATPAVIEALRAKGFHVTRISLTKPSMDEVYLEYTGRTLRDAQADSEEVRKQRFTMMRARR
ncbi:MAG TPA: ATP-binding cassette domain-containing protein [Nitrososphaerales archaeon]|nr:ATP-binding cassette domain-containing protein [Nitrososphaerales archaeon]